IGIEEDSFVPIGIFLTYPFVLAASGDAPYSNMAELADYAKENDVVLGHFGAGLTPTAVSMAAASKMGFEFADDSAFDLLDCNTLSSGDADVINTTLALIEPCLGEINVLGNIGADPIGKLDGVETIAAQSGVNDVELWNGLFVTKGTPQEVIDTIAAVAEKTMASEAAQQLMAETGAAVYWQGQDAAQARIAADREKSAEINAILGR
ncbi:MAG: tripartite tricarboxylate transporter substrate-binding protein, partial [Pseudomonadota bacterium]